MLEKTFTYTDYLDQERTETHKFHLTKADLYNWLATNGDYTLDKVLLRIGQDRDVKSSFEMIEDLIRRSYCRISVDGRRLERSKEVKDAFMESECYSMLFTELVNDAKKMAEFVEGILPKDISKDLEAFKANITPDQLASMPAEMRDYLDIDDKGEVVDFVVK